MLNPVSILLVTVLSSLMSVAMLGSLQFAAIPGVRRWIVAGLLWVVSMALVALQSLPYPKFVSVVLTNALLAYSITLIYEGCRQFQGLRPVVFLPYAGCAGVFLGSCYWLYVSPSFSARVVLVSVFHAALYASIGWTIWRHRPRRRARYSYVFFLVMALLSVLGHALRGLVYLLGWTQQTDLLQLTPINLIFLASGILSLPSLSIGMVMLAHDRLAERLEKWANIDTMTGALVRRAFMERAQSMLERDGSGAGPVSLAIIDIDHFKSINDRHGHAAGDQVLAHVGRLIGTNLRKDDLFGRIGGEEFGILLPGTGRQDALARIEALRQLIVGNTCQASSAGQGRIDLDCTFSAGVGEHRPGETLSSLMARADAALYAAKSLGRDRVVGTPAPPER